MLSLNQISVQRNTSKFSKLSWLSDFSTARQTASSDLLRERVLEHFWQQQALPKMTSCQPIYARSFSRTGEPDLPHNEITRVMNGRQHGNRASIQTRR